MFKRPPSFVEVCAALEALKAIERPDADNEGAPINANSVFDHLSSEDQNRVLIAEERAREFTRLSDGKPNRRGLTSLRKRGYDASLDPDQYDPYRLRGNIGAGPWDLDISDPQGGEDAME